MPFFLKPCIKLRKKKKKAIKKNSSMYFKSYIDKESPVTSEAIQEGASTSFASIDRDEKELGLLTRLILGSPELQTDNTEAKESGKTENITEVPSPDRDILDILSSAVEQLSEENSSSDDNRYSILSSSHRPDEETDNIEFRGLLNESFEISDDQLNDARKKQLLDIFMKDCVEDFVGDELKNHDFIIASKLSKNEWLTEISNAEQEGTVEVTKVIPVKECSADIIAFVSKHHKITEVEPLLPLTILNCSIERTVQSVSANESAEINQYKYEEMACAELEDASTFEASAINLIPSSEKNDWESESALNIQEVLPTVSISDQQEEKYEPIMNQFLNPEQSLAVQKVLGVSFCDNDLENAIHRFSADSLKPNFETGHFEITGASNQQETEEIINPFERINLSFGDNSPELLKRESNTTENILLNDVVFNDAHNTSKVIDQLMSPILSECCGDHSANVTNTYTKGLTCRMAAVRNDLSSNFSTNEMSVDPKIKSNTKPCLTINKRRRSRNFLIRSLNIKLSPEDLKREINNADQHCSDERFEKRCIDSPSEKHNSCNDLDLQMSEIKQLCDKIEKKEIVGHSFIFKSKPMKTLRNNIDERNNFNHESTINNLENKDVSSFIESTLNSESQFTNCKNLEDRNAAKKLKNYSVKRRNDPLSIEKVSNSFEITEELQMGILQVIKKILSFVQREVSLFYLNNEYEPKSLKYFMKELLFDYKFYEDQKNEKQSEKQQRIEYAEDDPFEPDGEKTAAGGDQYLSNCKFNDSGIKVNENCELSQGKYDIYCENMKSFNINFDSSNRDKETSANFENFCDKEIIAKEEEGRMLLTTEIRSKKEKGFDDLKIFQSLDEYLVFGEQLKCQNKKQKSKPILTPANSSVESKNLPDDFIFETLHNCNENATCFQMTSESPSEVSPLNDFKHFSFDDINLLDEIEEDKVLESPNLPSEGRDIGKNDLYMEPLTSCGDKCLKMDISKDSGKSEMSDSKTETHLLESNADESTLCEQDSGNHFTIVLSPRKNSATVNYSVNMTIGGNTCPTSVTSPISIQVTREDIRKKERFSIKPRDNDSKSSTEDITGICRPHRARLFDSEELERKRLRNLELYHLNKSEAMKTMGKQTRVIPIHPAESFEFTLSNLDNLVKSSKRSANHSVKSRKHELPRMLTPFQIRHKNFKPAGDDTNSYSSSNISSVHELDMEQEKISTDQIFRRRYDSPKSPIYGTPVRRKILTASKAIRSPKYSLNTDPSPLKGTRRQKASPHKIVVNNPKLYFLDESSCEHQREETRRSQVSEKAKHFDDYQRALHSPFNNYRQHLLCTKLASPTDLSTKFDNKFKRYARRGRNTGDLISYKRSTQWLRDAGIVGQVLTAEEADRAFKCAAGVKVALNKCDYRRFLYKLSRLKRLRYNEIYERLSKAVNEFA